MAEIIAFPTKTVESARSGERVARNSGDEAAMFGRARDIYLSNRWRIVDDGTQWVIQILKPGGWISRSCCTTRSGLFRRIKQYGICADSDSMAMISDLPAIHRV